MSCASFYQLGTPQTALFMVFSKFPLASILSIKPEIVTTQLTFKCLQMRIFCDHKTVLFLLQLQNSLNR